MAVTLEFLLSFGALFGSVSLITHPDGSGLQMPIEWLEGTPFNDYLVPGIILFVVNGVFPLIVIGLAVRRHRIAPAMVTTSGALLAGWIVSQIALLRMFYAPLHLPYLVLGLSLVALGFAWWRMAGAWRPTNPLRTTRA